MVLNLPWLLPAPGDFRTQARALRKQPTVEASDLIGLASHSLDTSQLTQLAKIVSSQSVHLTGSSLRSVKLAIAATHTVDFLADAMPGTGLRHGLMIETFQSDYGQAAQSVFDSNSALYRFDADFVWFSLDPTALGLARPLLNDEDGDKAVEAALDHVIALRDAVRANSASAVVLSTVPASSDAVFGSFDASQPGSVRWMLQRFNARLAEEVAQAGDLFFDLAALAETVGYTAWCDPQRWHDAKLPFSLDAVPVCADHLSRLLASAQGLSRKCLVLDLDNTLWGGVIGDDGVDGITLGQGSGEGEAFLAIQTYAKQLRDRGVILAVCSKNEEMTARLPFQQHDEMVLREDDISAFVANWTDKASNIRHIAKMLNIGTDALVFLDDNPAERERVRQELPEVAVPEVGAEPSRYPSLLAAGGYFEAISFGDEDRNRAAMYQANAARASELQKIGNMDEYLQSLEMVCSIRPFDALGRARITQLINKSNQFNLTTKRYSDAEVEQIEVDPGKHAIQVRLTDKFGDNGMISVVIFDKGNKEWTCDTWLMSCRVLGRRTEEAVLAHVAQAARDAGVTRLIGRYLPTAKNMLVEKHFEKLGFEFQGKSDSDGTRWVLDLAMYQVPALPMTVEPTSEPSDAA